MAASESLRKRISDLVAEHPVVLFMKGNRQAPQCGFSAQVVQILDGLLPQYETVDVLMSPELREGIKEFSQWPTIPQLYVDGRFIGGCDIVRELNGSGELQKVLGAKVAAAPAVPTIAVSEAAAKAFATYLADAGGDSLRLKIDRPFQYDLFLGPREPGDVEVTASGVTFVIDPASARRASDVSIDFIDGSDGGFKISQPNEPPKVKSLSATELKTMLDRGEVVVFDVRPESERALARIEGVRSLDEKGREDLAKLDRNTPIALHCHHGVRSLEAARHLIGEGFRNVYNLSGGIEAWSRTVDPSVPRY
jgi:monothiol glutaredoxin